MLYLISNRKLLQENKDILGLEWLKYITHKLTHTLTRSAFETNIMEEIITLL